MITQLKQKQLEAYSLIVSDPNLSIKDMVNIARKHKLPADILPWYLKPRLLGFYPMTEIKESFPDCNIEYLDKVDSMQYGEQDKYIAYNVAQLREATIVAKALEKATKSIEEELEELMI
jgi:hypothetical protein